MLVYCVYPPHTHTHTHRDGAKSPYAITLTKRKKSVIKMRFVVRDYLIQQGAMHYEKNEGNNNKNNLLAAT